MPRLAPRTVKMVTPLPAWLGGRRAQVPAAGRASPARGHGGAPAGRAALARRVLLAAGLLLIVAGDGRHHAAAQPVARTASAPTVLALLASHDYHARQAATERLLQDRQGTLKSIRRLYQAAEVDEQRHRLMDVAFHYAMRDSAKVDPPGSGNGFIGIEMVPAVGDAPPEPAPEAYDAVVVVRTFPGFPGHAHLRPADVILSVNNHRVDHETFTQRVSRLRPGQPVTLMVRRDGRTMRVQFPLGDRAALPRLYGPDGRLLPQTRQHLDRVRAMVSGRPVPADTTQLGRGPTEPAAGGPASRADAPTQD